MRAAAHRLWLAAPFVPPPDEPVTAQGTEILVPGPAALPSARLSVRTLRAPPLPLGAVCDYSSGRMAVASFFSSDRDGGAPGGLTATRR
jgi:hypothetical protein